jgi:hypothetical protein
MKVIKLTQGKEALVDDEDFEELNQYDWFASKTRTGNFYARRHLKGSRQANSKLISMHRQILPGHAQIDHEDGNGLNNQRSNLRPATGTQNNANKGKVKGRTSKFKGVYWYKSRGRWRTGITVHEKFIHLGYFTDETEAALAYNKAAVQHFGEFAKVNLL